MQRPHQQRRSSGVVSGWALLRNFLTSIIQRVGSTSSNRWPNSCSSLTIPGKAVWVSDFLFPLSDVRTGLSLMRDANFDLALIQILGHEEIDPPLFPGGARLTDSESEAEVWSILTLGPNRPICSAWTDTIVSSRVPAIKLVFTMPVLLPIRTCPTLSYASCRSWGC